MDHRWSKRAKRLQITHNRFYSLVVLLMVFFIASTVSAQESYKPDKLLYGVAYYDEYMPYDRLEEDVKMMKEAGINVVRIGESTWGTVEPQAGVYDFRHIDRVLDAMNQAGIKVIVGTPTYAVPTWLAKKYPDVLAITPKGQNQYGMRQNMDITSKHFRQYAEDVIRKMVDHVKDHPAVIGFQIDNETKAYNTSGPNVQKLFVEYMKKKYPSLEDLNKELGLDYWSNRINSWGDFPSTNGAINASLTAEFAKFQRQLVTDYLEWQSKIVREYKKPNQFVTQNFDLEWRGYSYGIQPDVDHFAAEKALDIVGIDIYHPTQDHLTGVEISFAGDLARSLKKGQNYLVIETEAQGFPGWVPYPGQLRLQAFSHLASGADMVEYWPWHSIHNGAETYWKGLLGHDFSTNPTYEEAKTIGKDFDRLSSHLIHVKKKNQVAILVSNEALTAFNAFSFGWGRTENYNDVLRPYYDALYNMNIGVDFVNPASTNFEDYKLLVVPALYAASDALLERLNTFVEHGGHVVYTLKSGFSNENVKVRTGSQPGVINKSAGVFYNQFVYPENVSLQGDPFHAGTENKVVNWMELVTPITATVLAYYEHPVWGKYAAVTRNQYGMGQATYVACMTTNAQTEKIMEDVVKNAGLWGPDQQIKFPIITKTGINELGKTLHYYFNYSDKPGAFTYPYAKAAELLNDKKTDTNETVTIDPWGVLIIEEL